MTELERVEPVDEAEWAGDERAPWDRFDDEPSGAHHVFARYLDMGPDRSFKGICEALDIPRASIRAWTSRYSWVERARSWDTHVDRRARAVLERDIIASRQRHANLGRLIQEKVAQGLANLDPATMSPKDLIYALDTAVKLERAARGDSDAKRVELTGAGGGPIAVVGEMNATDRAKMLAEVRAQVSARLGLPNVAEEIIEAEVVDGPDQ